MPAKDEVAIEDRLRYHFRDQKLLELALKHSSTNAPASGGGDGRDNTRLAWLGDAVLYLLATEHLYHSFPAAGVDQLDPKRQPLVENTSLGKPARDLNLSRSLRLSNGAEASGRVMLAGAFEAVIGAVYLDGGLEEARKFLRRTIFEVGQG